MKFSSYEEIIENYIFLKDVIEKLDDNYFLYMTRREIILEKESIIAEFQADTSFKLVTKFEADIRTNFNDSIKAKKKDCLSSKYLALCYDFRKKCKEYDKPLEKLCRRLRLENILDVIKLYYKELGNLLHKKCSDIKGCLHFRHWYAHGRYFRHRVPIPEPEDLFIICDEIITEVINR